MRVFILVMVLIMTLVVVGCEEENGNGVEPTLRPTAQPTEQPTISREGSIPSDAVKGTPETDHYPPVLHSDEYEEPVPMPGPINTAGAEDSPFIPVDRDEMYFVFVKDVREEPHIQIRDVVNGMWVSKIENGAWQEPELVMLQEPGKLALNGCQYVQGNEMMFCSVREGYEGPHWFSAEFKNGEWTDWENADFNPEYDVGELHIYGDELYYHADREGGKGQSDIWMLTKVNGEWTNPVNVAAVNSADSEGMPYITPDGQELWFNRTYLGSPGVFRSKRVNGEWQEPELIVSQFAGEPTLDKYGNVYFVHHYYEDGVMIEADIYVGYKK